MTPEQYYKFLQSHGFTVMDTGGGCTAWHKELPNDQFILTSHELSHEINPEWLAMGLPVHVGVFEGDEWLDMDQNSEHLTVASAAQTISKLLEGTK